MAVTRRQLLRVGVRAFLATLAVLGAFAPRAAAVGTVLATEPFAVQQWALERIEAEAAWQVTRGAGALVGVVDTGADLRHEEFQSGKVVDSRRCVGTGGVASRCTGSSGAQDDNGHGTHVAGVIAAPLNGRGVGGVAPDAGLLIAKSVGADGTGLAEDVVASINWLIGRGADVINLSLADASTIGRIGDPSSPIGQAIRRGWSEGVIFVLAAGNSESGSGGQSQNYGTLPAIVVGATTKDDRTAPYSLPLGDAMWGIVAPGGDGAGGAASRKVVSSFWFRDRPSEHYAFSQGTSVAAPHVAGVAALALAKGLAPQAVVDAILENADPVSCGQGCHGRLNARRAVGAPPLAAAPPPATKQPPASPPTAAPLTAPPTSTPAVVDPTTTITAPLAHLPFEERAAPQAAPPVLASDEEEDELPLALGLVGALSVAFAGAGTATVGYLSRRRTVTTRP